MLLLRNCRLIPELTEDFDSENGDVLLDGDQISGLYPVSVVPEMPDIFSHPLLRETGSFRGCTSR